MPSNRSALFGVFFVLLNAPGYALSNESASYIETLRARIKTDEPVASAPAGTALETSLADGETGYMPGRELAAKYAEYRKRVYGSQLHPIIIYKQASANVSPEDYVDENNNYQPGKALAMRLAAYRAKMPHSDEKMPVEPEIKTAPYQAAPEAKITFEEPQTSAVENAAEDPISFNAPDLVISAKEGSNDDDAVRKALLEQKLEAMRRKRESGSQKEPQKNDGTSSDLLNSTERALLRTQGKKKEADKVENSDDSNDPDTSAESVNLRAFQMPKNYRIIVR